MLRQIVARGVKYRLHCNLSLHKLVEGRGSRSERVSSVGASFLEFLKGCR
jgi:hypothetical protein